MLCPAVGVPSPGRWLCPGETGVIPREHHWVTRSNVTLEKSFFLLNSIAKNATWLGRWEAKVEMPDLTASGKGWEHDRGLQPPVKTAVLLQRRVLFG